MKRMLRKLIWILAGLILLGGIAALLKPIVVRALGELFWSGVDDIQTGLKEGVPLSSAVDCPFELPQSASDIHYAYELYWQGGCAVCRYTFPIGDLKKQGESHLKKSVAWTQLGADVIANVPEHRFAKYNWFRPSSIVIGWESDTSGILWEPKVWVDETNRYIYVIEQN